jgi:hypothetical protein
VGGRIASENGDLAPTTGRVLLQAAKSVHFQSENQCNRDKDCGCPS